MTNNFQSDKEYELRLQVLRAQERASESRRQLNDARVWNMEAAQEIQALRESIAMQIGSALVMAVKSPRAALQFPAKMMKIIGDLRNRRATHVGKLAQRSSTPVPHVLSAPPPDATEIAVEPLVSTTDVPGRLDDLRIACVLDDFSYNSLKPDCQLLALTPSGWPEALRAFKPHVLLVESCWLGEGSAWKGLVFTCSEELRGLVAACREAGIPTVFWNKEDPLHFEAFIQTAALFDTVFTTDAECIARYKRELGHARVYLMPFALQPAMFGPIHGSPRKDAFFFAGAYYARLAERSEDLERVVDAMALVGPVDIYDRNSSNPTTNSLFPDKYRSQLKRCVPYTETADLYRSYRFGINLNTIKNSPSMFARRVFELIGAGTAVYGNRSRGVSLMLGDLTVSSDDSEELFAAAWQEFHEPAHPQRSRRVRALRKVLEQHTYARRLTYLAEKALGIVIETRRVPVVVIAAAGSSEQLKQILDAYARQTLYKVARLIVAVPESLRENVPACVQVLPGDLLGKTPAQAWPDSWIVPFIAQDYYGPEYLKDLVLATQYTRDEAIGKGAYSRFDDGIVQAKNMECEYRSVDRLALRRSMLRVESWPGTIADLLASIEKGFVDGPRLSSIDALSYLEDGASAVAPPAESQHVDEGVDISELLDFAERLPALASRADDDAMISGASLAHWFSQGTISTGLSAAPRRHRLEICSTLGAHMRGQIWSCPLPRTLLERDGKVSACVDAMADSALSFVLEALDRSGTTIARWNLPAEVNMSCLPPVGTEAYRIGAEVRGPLVRHVDGVWLQPHRITPLVLPGAGRLLLVTNGYPEQGNLYRNAFVHRRVLAYRRLGIPVDVVQVVKGSQRRSYEFDGVPVDVCDPATLAATLAISGHEAIMVHFLDAAIWRGIESAAMATRTVVWLHGAEIQPWSRRIFNYTTEEHRAGAIRDSDERMAFWRALFRDPPPGLHVNFVSSTFAEQVWADIGFRLPEDRWRVIHNPIDTTMFAYVPKPDEQRFKVLSVRPHDSRIYANDLVAKTIHELARDPLFERMRFHLVGDGALFEENFSGLDRYPNVLIERRFLRQRDIARLHRDYGLFLVPTRGDTQGVSRDEAMASGLVPLTNAVGSVPEFVDAGCAVMAPADDASALARDMLSLMRNPADFSRMSRAAADRVRKQSGINEIISRELEWCCPSLAGRASQCATTFHREP